jgi:hypothetical protein
MFPLASCKCKCKKFKHVNVNDFTFTLDLHTIYTSIDIYMHNIGCIPQEPNIVTNLLLDLDLKSKSIFFEKGVFNKQLFFFFEKFISSTSKLHIIFISYWTPLLCCVGIDCEENIWSYT